MNFGGLGLAAVHLVLGSIWCAIPPSDPIPTAAPDCQALPSPGGEDPTGPLPPGLAGYPGIAIPEPLQTLIDYNTQLQPIISKQLAISWIVQARMFKSEVGLDWTSEEKGELQRNLCTVAEYIALVGCAISLLPVGNKQEKYELFKSSHDEVWSASEAWGDAYFAMFYLVAIAQEDKKMMWVPEYDFDRITALIPGRRKKVETAMDALCVFLYRSILPQPLDERSFKLCDMFLEEQLKTCMGVYKEEDKSLFVLYEKFYKVMKLHFERRDERCALVGTVDGAESRVLFDDVMHSLGEISARFGRETHVRKEHARAKSQELLTKQGGKAAKKCVTQ